MAMDQQCGQNQCQQNSPIVKDIRGLHFQQQAMHNTMSISLYSVQGLWAQQYKLIRFQEIVIAG